MWLALYWKIFINEYTSCLVCLDLNLLNINLLINEQLHLKETEKTNFNGRHLPGLCLGLTTKTSLDPGQSAVVGGRKSSDQ